MRATRRKGAFHETLFVSFKLVLFWEVAQHRGWITALFILSWPRRGQQTISTITPQFFLFLSQQQNNHTLLTNLSISFQILFSVIHFIERELTGSTTLKMLLPKVTLALSVLQTVATHSVFTTLFVNDVNQGDGTCVRMGMTPHNCTFPISDLVSNNMACGMSIPSF